MNIPQALADALKKLSVEEWFRCNINETGYYILGVICFAIMGYTLYRIGVKKDKPLADEFTS
jgi:hypothetical protein